MNMTVVKSTHTATYEEPITLLRGDTVTMTGRWDNWEDHIWLWAKAPDGKEGWIPDNLASRSGDTWLASDAYSARELSCAEGEALRVTAYTHGWCWCTNSAGDTGWVPDRNLGSFKT